MADCRHFGVITKQMPGLVHLFSEMTIREWCKAAYQNAEAHGFGVNPIPTRLMLIVTEVAEAMEAWRESMGTVPFGEELADICLRTFDLAEVAGVDLETAIETKHTKNLTRPYLHGGKRA